MRFNQCGAVTQVEDVGRSGWIQPCSRRSVDLWAHGSTTGRAPETPPHICAALTLVHRRISLARDAPRPTGRRDQGCTQHASGARHQTCAAQQIIAYSDLRCRLVALKLPSETIERRLSRQRAVLTRVGDMPRKVTRSATPSVTSGSIQRGTPTLAGDWNSGSDRGRLASRLQTPPAQTSYSCTSPTGMHGSVLSRSGAPR